jgi:small redox-active disulfide protein 2
MLMSSDEITRIKIGKDRIGIIGLKIVLAEVAETAATQTDEEIRAELLRRLDKRNYIPGPSKAEYGKAFLREFKKFAGCSIESKEPDGLEIRVLGPGCARCDQLTQDLIAVMAEMDMAADLEHVTDIAEIASYGVMGTPALVVNGEVKSAGSIPPKTKLKQWLQDAFTKQSGKKTRKISQKLNFLIRR